MDKSDSPISIMSRSNNWPARYFMNTRLDYLWEKVSLFTQFSDLAKIFEPIFFKISLKTGPIFDHPLLVKIGSEIRKSVQNRKTNIFSSPATRTLVIRHKVYKTTARWNFVRMTWHYSTKCLPMKFSLEPEFNRFLVN